LCPARQSADGAAISARAISAHSDVVKFGLGTTGFAMKFISINGELRYLWCAVNRDGDVRLIEKKSGHFSVPIRLT